MRSHESAHQPARSATSPPIAPRTVAPLWQRSVRRAERQIKRGLYDDAVASLERALASGAEIYSTTLRIADIYRTTRRWPAAIELAERAISIAPACPVAYEMVMAIAVEAGDQERLIAASQSLLKVAPRHIPAHSTLGAVYIQRGDVESALQVTDTLLRLDPANAGHHFKKALLSQHIGEIPDAVHEFLETLVLDPDGPHSTAAREALDVLDAYQMNQIFTLAGEDAVFRAKLYRDAISAAYERGFLLTETGNLILTELSKQPEMEIPESRPSMYN